MTQRCEFNSRLNAFVPTIYCPNAPWPAQDCISHGACTCNRNADEISQGEITGRRMRDVAEGRVER